MAEDKKSFILYADSYGLIKQLPDEIAGKLFKHIFAYVNDENPKSEDLLLNIAFEPIKTQLKRDLQKWDKNKSDRSVNGRMGNLKRYNLDLYNDVLAEKINLEYAENVAKSRKVSLSEVLPSLPVAKDSDTIAKLAVNDNVNVSVNVNDIKDNTLTSDSEQIDFEKLQKYWNGMTEKTLIPKIQIFSEQRKKRVKWLIKTYGRKEFEKAIKNLFESDFCTGKNGNWKADFDFLCQQSSFVKLIEGSYSNNKPTQQTQSNVSPPSQYKRHE